MLWSHWQEGDESPLSFAAVTDDPPAEIAAHEHSIIPIKPANVEIELVK